MTEITTVVAQSERNLGAENLYRRLQQGKELADLRAGLNLLQNHLSQGEFYSNAINQSGAGRDVFLGDYGNMPSFTQDYLLDRLFQTILATGADGKPLSVGSLRTLATQSSDEYPQLKLVGENGGTIDTTFFGGRNSSNFSCWLRGLPESTKARIASTLDNIPPRVWAKSIVQQLAEQQGQILSHEGVVALSMPDQIASSTYDLTFFLNTYGFSPRYGWTREEVEIILAGGTIPDEKGAVARWVDPITGEGWSVLSTQAMKGVGLAFRKHDSSTAVSVLIDTAELRGRNTSTCFLDSVTSREILSVFEELDLEPSDEMLNDFTEGSLGFGHYSSRYGNGYADLSRLVTYVAREGLGLERLVNIKNPNITAEDLLVKAKNLSAPAELILKLMAGIIKRTKEEKEHPRMSFSGQSIRDGSCKDSEVYFSGSLKLGKSFHEGAFVCKSGYGSDTKMNTVPIDADGIEFPPGYLFRVGEKGELEPLRATMYCFNDDEARDAFGWQYEECLNNDSSLKWAIGNFPEGWNNPNRTRST